jgi:hypothetical protein
MDWKGESIAAWSREAELRARNMVQAKTYDSYADFYRGSPYSVAEAFPHAGKVVAAEVVVLIEDPDLRVGHDPYGVLRE